MPRGSSGKVKNAFELHAHTTCSDGLLDPEALVALAAARGLRALAITDHDTLAGVERARAAAARAPAPLEVVPGVEVTCGVRSLEVHVLGYFVDPACAALAGALEALRADRRDRVGAILERLGALGAGFDPALLDGAHAPTRGHMARVLVRLGHASSTRDAFERFLGAGAPAYAPKRLIDVTEAVRLIHGAGGVAVLAHPGRYSAPPDLDAVLAAGIDGLEAYYPSHGEGEVERYAEIARARGLVATGGSDFHGPDGRLDLGAHLVPADALEALRARAAGARAAAAARAASTRGEPS